jgi:hypothetical protein
MSRDPKWRTQLDLVYARAASPITLLAGWVTFLVGRLPPAERAKVASAIAKGMSPKDYEDAMSKEPTQ